MAYAYGTGTASNGGDRLYIGTGGTDGSGNANSIDVVGGKYFTELFPTSNVCRIFRKINYNGFK